MIKTKRWIKPLITTVLLLLLVAMLGITGDIYAYKKSEKIASQTLPSLAHLTMANQYRGQGLLHLVVALNSTNDTQYLHEKEQVQYFSTEGTKELKLYSDTLITIESRRIYDQLMSERANTIRVREAVMAYAEAGDRQRAIKEFNDNLLPMIDLYMNNMQKLMDNASKEGLLLADSIQTSALWSVVLTVVCSLLIFILGFFLGYTR